MVYGTTKKPTRRPTSGKGRWTTKPKPRPKPKPTRPMLSKVPTRVKSEAMKAMRQRQAARAARGAGQPGYGKPAKKTSWQKRNMMGPRKDRNQPGYEGKQAKRPLWQRRRVGGQKPIPRRAPWIKDRGEKIPASLAARARSGAGAKPMKHARDIQRRAMKQPPKGDTYNPKAPRQSTQYITGKTTGKPVQARQRTATY